MAAILLWFLYATTLNLRMGQSFCNGKDQHELSIFKQSINDPLKRLSSWSTEEDCCKWIGVQCDNITGRVSKLDLHCPLGDVQCLEGEINFSVFKLEFLNFLDLSSNNFKAIIHFPNGSSNISNLIYLGLSMNYNLHMESLRWVSSLSSLKYMNLSGVFLKDETLWLQHMTMLPFPSNLSSLILRNNGLKGLIPEWIGQYKHLEELDLSNNSFSGPIPSAFGNLSSLRSLDVSINHLNGSLPRDIGKLSKLEVLSMGFNSFSGILSEQSFTKLSNLKSLSLDSSDFVFDLGSQWKPPFQLEKISFSYCKLGPKFPSWIYSQRSLFYLDLSSSGLSFNVDEYFWSFLKQIDHLFLSNNSIHGDISTALINNTQIDLKWNNFSGKLPHLSPKVIFFDISNNSFSGPVFSFFCQSMIVEQQQLLDVLDMSHNLLSGELPECWMKWQSLLHVNLGSNNLTGKIPDSVGSLIKLQTFRVRNNSLFGNIPTSLKSCKSLWYLDLGLNKFTGNIPHWFTNLSMALLLPSNKFSGTIPLHICELSNLLVLDLSNNRLSGPIPKCLYKITTMVSNSVDEALFMSYFHNWFLAPISVRSNLEDLPLFVKGQELNYWHALKFMHSVDLSSNDLSGSIPSELFRLIALQSLNLSYNHLIGKISSDIGHMRFLESLDLSRNLLSGEIPLSMSNLSFMSFLNLSYNDFNGKIPLGTQLQSFDASSYIAILLWFLYATTLNLRMGHSFCNGKDQHELSVFKQSIKDPLKRLSSWSTEEDCCKWIGVQCDNITGRVSKLDLHCPFGDVQCLEGEISFSVFKLEFLTFLDLSSNDFKAIIHFPNESSNISNLIYLDLSMNYNLHMESLRWVSSLSSLKYMNLSGIFLKDETLWLQHMTMLPFPSNLSSLILRNNGLKGLIPEWIGQYKNLEELDLSNNSFSGPIPSTFGNLSSLRSLNVSFNHLNGSLPRDIGKLSKLEVLSMGFNSFSGILSEQSFTKLSNLRSLSLDSSNFVFDLGSQWNPPFQLEKISFSYCKLGPKFPSWIYSQRSLFYLDLSSSGLSFNVDEYFWSFVKQIDHLFLSNNSIHGDISTALINNTQIDLKWNNFSGKLPHLSPKVVFFDISNNSFSGPIFSFFCQSMIVEQQQHLAVLDLSQNLLSGELPDQCWMKWQSLLHVNLGSNNLTGKIPGSIGSLINLQTFRVRNNSLFGNIPTSLESCKSLWYLDLGFNQFTGNIPIWFTNLSMALLLPSNKFSGTIPLHICELTNLLVLDLSNNRLSGPIPKCLYKITTMVSNSVDEALFMSYIRNWFLAPISARSNLEDLPLFVKGQELNYWHALKFMHSVDLSSNDLSGSIPSELFRLITLQSLNLSHNHLIGKIPSDIGHVRCLESLDLSRNLLSGEIPQSMSNLSFMSFLNLSYNHFSGKIPTGTQLQSFNASSYIGNSQLCGAPLPKNCLKSTEEKEEEESGDFRSSFELGMGVGFASAFWGVCGVIFFIRKWRHAYFQTLHNLYALLLKR
ncbi:receptor-like protein EIX2 [Gastrolobium bilobum]|uniref:receptor-like protein EIX2 n=1 Tax=Gastrolobium bilobum TaxID=150636 RepID=UPI002AAFF7B9|nr:receptor-like protein EIX2 [Gastrolobium bilobum]